MVAPKSPTSRYCSSYHQLAKSEIQLEKEEEEVVSSGLICLFMCCHDEMSPLLHSPGGADLSVRNVRGDEAQQTLQENLGTVVDVILLGGQFCQLILEMHKKVRVEMKVSEEMS